MLTYADQNGTSNKRIHLSEYTKSSLGPSVLVQGNVSGTGNKHNCDT